MMCDMGGAASIRFGWLRVGSRRIVACHFVALRRVASFRVAFALCASIQFSLVHFGLPSRCVALLHRASRCFAGRFGLCDSPQTKTSQLLVLVQCGHSFGGG